MCLRTVRLALTLILGIATASSLHAADGEPYPESLEQKLGAGLANATTGWVELAKTPMVISKKDGLGMGLSVGLAKGVVNTIGRTFWGVFDVVTFIIPTKPMIEPHMIWQDFDTETSYNSKFETYKN
jgi:putative exosortase-associated protein (TIGR04073 family)